MWTIAFFTFVFIAVSVSTINRCTSYDEILNERAVGLTAECAKLIGIGILIQKPDFRIVHHRDIDQTRCGENYKKVTKKFAWKFQGRLHFDQHKNDEMVVVRRTDIVIYDIIAQFLPLLKWKQNGHFYKMLYFWSAGHCFL